MQNHFSYEEHSRRPIVFLTFGGNLLLFALAISYGADWLFYFPLLISALMLSYMLLYNNISGCYLTDTRFAMYHNTWNQTVQVKDIAAVHVLKWSAGMPTIKLVLKTGKHEMVPDNCIGDDNSEKLIAELSGLGIPVVRR